MTIRHSNRAASVPAVAYVRRSTRRQEKSLADQRREIQRYANEHGYQIIRWYEDDGISGDATEKRDGFLAMHRAAVEARDFDAILVWDQDRFGRFNSLEAGYWVHPLVTAGISLVTVTEGPINWQDFTGRVMYGLKQEGKHQFLRDLSRNTARGQITNAQNGYLCGQAAPYGYDRMLIDETGKHRQRVRNGEQFAKPRSWHVTLVPSDDPEKLKTAKWLFHTYAETDIGLRALADGLNRRGVPGPRGNSWWVGTIREILRNHAYVGDFVWGKRRIGKYHRVSGGTIKERNPRERGPNGDVQAKHNSESEWIVKQDAHPALVSREIFAGVQEKLTARKRRTTSGKTKNGDRYILTGLVRCGHCGAKMYGTRKTRRKKGKTYQWEKYICSTYHTQGKSKCGYHSVDQQPLLAFLLRKLRDAVLLGGHREALKEHVRNRLSARKADDPAHINAVEVKLGKLDNEIAQGTKRLLRAPDDIADLLATELSKVRRERDRVASELDQLKMATRPVDLEVEVDAAVDHLWTLHEEFDKAQPARLRELIHRMVSRIELHFDHVQKGSRVECPLSRGTIDLRPDPILYRLVSRGDRI